VRSTKTGEEKFWQSSELNLSWAKPQWFPDGRSLFIHPGRGKMIQLDTRTGSTQFLLNSESLSPYAGGNLYRPGAIMAPNGRSVFYISHEVENKPQRAAMYSADRIRIIRRDLPDGAERELCRFDAETGFGPFPSPDGRRIAFWVNFHDRRSALMTISADGGAPVEVRTGQSYMSDDRELKPGQFLPREDSVAWSPAGRLFFITQAARWGDPDSDEIWSVPAEGGEAQALGLRLHHLWSLDVSPDGRRLVFQDEQPRTEMWVLKNLISAAKPAH
jgi:Tol biopolymer transport system component